MKLIITVILATFMAIQTSYARVDGMGLKGGVAFGNLWGNDSELDLTETNMRTGICVGLFLEMAMNPVLSFQPEIRFVQKGETFEAGNSLVSGKWDVYLNYIEIPVSVKISIPVSEMTKPFLYVGPFIGFNVSSSNDNIYEVGPFGFDTETDLDDETRNIESGIFFGAGIKQVFEYTFITFDIRYTTGLTQVFDNDVFDEVYTGTMSIEMGIGIVIP